MTHARSGPRDEHSLDDCRAAIAAWEDAQPVYLACGCLGGTHDNTVEALHEAHPDVLGWLYTGPFYGSLTL